MADILSIATAATNTYKRAIEVTSHNVANIGTEGYSRQRAEIVSNTPSITGPNFLGGGSKVSSIERVYAEYIQNQYVNANSLKQRYEEQLVLSKKVEGIIASNDEGVQDFMQRLFDSFQNLAGNPTSSANRQLVIDESNNMESLIKNMVNVLNETGDQVNNQVRDLVAEINNRVDTINTINQQVASAISNDTQPPNDLLDQRDQAIFELGQYMDIKTFPQEDGQVNVYTGDGRLPLITDGTVNYLESGRTEFTDEGRTEVFMNIAGQRRMISDNISHGELGAVLDFRKNMLDKSMNELGLTLNGLVASTNWQHYQGYDLNGDAGGNIYEPLNMTALKSNRNNGPEDGSNISVSFTPNIAALPGFNGQPPYTPATQPATYGDKQTFLEAANTAIGEFQAREYEVRVNGAGNYDIYDHKAGGTPLATVAFGGTVELDGLFFDFSTVGAGTVQTGDKFLIKPHQEMMQNFDTVITDGKELATRGQTPIDANNDDSLLDEVPSPAAYGDNVNFANMASLQTKKLLYADASGNASESLLGGYSVMATNVGMYVRGTDIQLTAQTNVFDQVSLRRESYSGVSMDEEAANLLRFQQAYEAAAQMIQTSQTLFQSILNVIN